MLGQAAVLLMELGNITQNTTKWTKGTDNTVSQLADRGRQLKRWREDIKAAKYNPIESRDANERYFNQRANLKADDLQIGNLVSVHETMIELSDGSQLDARWGKPSYVTEIAQSLGTYQLAELDRVELMGQIDGDQLKKCFTHNESVHSTHDISMPSTTQRETSGKFESFESEAVVGRICIEGRWMYLVKWTDWEK